MEVSNILLARGYENKCSSVCKCVTAIGSILSILHTNLGGFVKYAKPPKPFLKPRQFQILKNYIYFDYLTVYLI